ncbi:hypothetical protein CCR75_003119 [Bremia lactucae]|uniref:Uncharacterized protein n=1 Tax=Bremia lactucae TaxID=4779 RepID=A0A976ID87_BRELC|nr:hypothetical protein CCR75_003119 [Bremia lactucae]
MLLLQTIYRYVKREASKKLFKSTFAEQLHLLHTIAATQSVDLLIRSDLKVLGMDLHALSCIPNLVRLEHKVHYLAMLAEEHLGSIHVSISRTSENNQLDIILQQLHSTLQNDL